MLREVRARLVQGPKPLDSAPAIPVHSGQTLFFFGTLMDLDILAKVLARPLDMGDLRPAALSGFARRRAHGVSYPVLAPDKDAVVDGRVLQHASARDVARINHFEADEYRAQCHRVDIVGRPSTAWLYIGLPGVIEPADELWELDEWARSSKSAFLAACDAWLHDAPA